MCSDPFSTSGRVTPDIAALKIVNLFRKHFGVDMSGDDMARFILRNWSSISTYAHVIHDAPETWRSRFGPAEEKLVRVEYKP